jgi:phosphoesterase RecJ-like protein
MKHQQAHDLIKQSKKILIATHVNPDLDAICSELVIAEYLRMQKKQFCIIHEKPLASMYGFLSGARQIKTMGGSAYDYDAAIIVDCADKARIGAVKELFLKDKPVINIDHHWTSDPFASVNIIDPEASSTAELIFETFRAWNVKLTKKMANYLYLGILTDTGSFRYQNTTARTHQIASELLGYGISPSLSYRLAYEDLDAQGFKLLSSVVTAAQYYQNGKVVSLALSAKTLKKIGDRFDLKDKLFYVLRMMKDVELIVVFSEVSAVKTRVNFRSTKKVDVAAIARIFGGGGHRAASGCVLEKNLRMAQKSVLAEVLRNVV